MKYLLTCFALGALLTACKTPNYYPGPVYAPVFANQFETQASGVMGTNGFSAKTGFAATKNISVGGVYCSMPGLGSFYSKEGEAIGGFQFKLNGSSFLAFHSGSGFGNSFKQDSGVAYKNFRGNFTKPFGMITIGSAHTSRKYRVHGDFSFTIKGSYLMYNGFKTHTENGIPVDEKFVPQNFFWEPYMQGSIGGKYVRFEYGTGFAFKRLTEIGEGNRIMPFQMNFGMSFIILRRYDAKPADVKKE